MSTARAITGSFVVNMANGLLVRQFTAISFDFTQENQGLTDESCLVLHTAARELPLGELVTPGVAWWRNLSTTDAVTFGVKLNVRLSGVTLVSGDATVTCASTTDLKAGMSLVGAGIPDGTTVSSITNGTTFEMSANATANLPAAISLTGTVTKTDGETTSASPTVLLSSTTGLFTGMTVTGDGIPAATTISAVSANVSITLSNNATATATGVTITATTTIAAVQTVKYDATVTCTSTASLAVGTVISGTGITTGTTVGSVTNGTTFELSAVAMLTQPTLTIYGYGTTMVPVAEAGPGKFAFLFLSDGVIPMAQARDATVRVMPWMAEA